MTADAKFDLRGAREFCRVFVHNEFAPLRRDTDYRLDPYLQESNLPEHRKEEYRRAWVPRSYFWRHQYLFHCKCFGKKEVLDRKPPHKAEQMPPLRLINSRSDSYKAAVGPYVHKMEKSIFNEKYFIKYVPVRDRMRWLIERLQKTDRVYLATDFTAFESHMTPGVMRTFEMQLYAHMLKFCPERTEVMRLLQRMAGKNVCKNRKFGSFSVRGVRMSGDMSTSLGNGITNLMVMFFVLTQRGIPLSVLDGVFEGDDGLISVPRQYESLLPNEKDFENMGCFIKLAVCRDVASSEFCGIVCDPKAMDNVVDAYGILVKFGWTTSSRKLGGDKIMKGLARSKAFSLVYEAPNNPITRALGDAVLRLTEGYECEFEEKFPSWWDQQVLMGVDVHTLPPKSDVKLESRQLMAEYFGIDILTQLRYEEYFSKMSSLGSIPNMFSSDIVAKSHVDMWNRNTAVMDRGCDVHLYQF